MLSECIFDLRFFKLNNGKLLDYINNVIMLLKNILRYIFLIYSIYKCGLNTWRNDVCLKEDYLNQQKL